MSREKEKEEKLFRAIGDLPEDMVADAANYQLPEKKAGNFGKLVQIGKGFACAACAAVIIFGLVPWIYDMFRGGDQAKTEKVAVEEQKSGVAFGSVATEERKEGTLYLWTEPGKVAVNMEMDQAGERKEKGSKESGQKKEPSAKRMKAGKTVRLYARDVFSEKESEGSKEVLLLRIGKSGDGIKYTIRSEISNCNVFSVISADGEVTEQADVTDVGCIGGDRLELNTFDRSEVCWAENPAPEWDGKDIRIIDIIHITGEKEGELYEFGRIVIGKKGENYYGVFQKGDD